MFKWLESIKTFWNNNILGHKLTSQPALTFRRIQYKIRYPFSMGHGVMRDLNLYAREGKLSHRWLPFIKLYGRGSSVGFALSRKDEKELQDNIVTQSVIFNEVKVVKTSTDRATLTNSQTKNVYWPGEVVTNTESKSTSIPEVIDIPVHVMLITLTASNQALEDPTFLVRDEFLEAAGEAIAVSCDQLVMYGDGQGKPEGLFRRDNSWKEKDYQDAYTNIRYPSDFITVVESKPSVADFQKLVDILPSKYRTNAKWIMNSNTGLYLASLKNEKGDYVIDQTLSVLQTVSIPDNYLGLPILYNEYVDDVGKAGKVPVFLGDYKKSYSIATRDGTFVRRFDDSQYAKLDQILLLGRTRIGGQIIDANAYRIMRIQPAFENEVIITPEPIVNVDPEGVTQEQMKEQMTKMSDVILDAVKGSTDNNTPTEPIVETVAKPEKEVIQ